jgi:hypothetical protein
MANSISIFDFKFKFSGYGHYEVGYTYPSGKQIWATIDDMTLIDSTKNAYNPKKKDLQSLKNAIKRIKLKNKKAL